VIRFRGAQCTDSCAQAQLADLTSKLAVNIAVDKTNAGLKSQDVSFTC
jgi:hypothetical protein